MWARRSRGESGAGGIVIAAILYPILGLMVFALMLGMQGWASAQSAVDDTADQAAKAAVSQTVTTPSGEIGIDCESAEAAAAAAFASSRGRAATGDRLSSFDENAAVVDGSNATVQAGQAAVTVQCVEPFEVTIPAYNYCPDEGGWVMLSDGKTCQRILDPPYESYCTAEGSVLVGNKCIVNATIWKCLDGRTVDQTTECDRIIEEAVCPSAPTLANEMSTWSGWTLSADKMTCVGSETAYLSPQYGYDCEPYGVTAPSTVVQSGQNCVKQQREYYCATGTMDGSVCRYVAQTATPSYSCQAGYTFSGNTCVMTRTWYTCPSGGTLSGTTCSYQEATYPNAYDVWVCYGGTNGRSVPGGNASQCYTQQTTTRQVPRQEAYQVQIRECVKYNKKGECTQYQTRTETRYRTVYDTVTETKWVVIGNATLERRQGTPVYVTRTYPAQVNSETLTATPFDPTCSSGFTLQGSSCVRYATTSQSIRTSGPDVILGPVRRTVLSAGPASIIGHGPAASTVTRYTPIRPTAEEITVSSTDALRRAVGDPIKEEKQFLTSSATKTFYRGVQVKIQDRYQAPLGGALDIDLTRVSEASLEQEFIASGAP